MPLLVFQKLAKNVEKALSHFIKVTEKIYSWIRIIMKFESPLSCIVSKLSLKFHENWSLAFWVILLTNKWTNKLTDVQTNQHRWNNNLLGRGNETKKTSTPPWWWWWWWITSQRTKIKRLYSFREQETPSYDTKSNIMWFILHLLELCRHNLTMQTHES